MSWLFKDPVVIMTEIMSSLLKDPIATVAWLNFDHARSNSKKDQITAYEISSWKTTNKFFMYLLRQPQITLFIYLLIKQQGE